MGTPFTLTLELLQQVRAIAAEAGRTIMTIYAAARHDERAAGVQTKADKSPLTLADLAAHRVLLAGLQKLTPDIPVVSEEEAASHSARNAEGLFWLLDPLDGTKEFIAQSGDFTVNVALVENGLPILGVVDAPALDLSYWGARGLGAFRTNAQGTQAIAVAQPDPTRPKRIVASKSHMNQETQDFIAQLGAHELVQAGSSLKLCRVADGSADIYPRLGPTCEWDTAAAHAVVNAAGGKVVQPDGAPVLYGKPDVLNPYFVVSAA